MYGIITDVHGNLEALETVLRHMHQNKGISKIICLGDAVGYGPNPNEVMDLIWAECAVKLIGNHDLAVLDYQKILTGEIKPENANDPTQGFNFSAAFAVDWTARNLNEQNGARLFTLIGSKSYVHIDKGIRFAHSQPNEPRNFGKYILNQETAMQYFFNDLTGICFVGHTHKPQLYYKREKQIKVISMEQGHDEQLDNPFEKDDDMLAVVPSVGQPRDGNNCAGYCVWNEEKRSLSTVRLSYDFYTTQAKMRMIENIPANLWQRIAVGK